MKLRGSDSQRDVRIVLTCEAHERISPDLESRVDETSFAKLHPWFPGCEERLRGQRIRHEVANNEFHSLAGNAHHCFRQKPCNPDIQP